MCPFHDREVLVTACGRLCLHRKRINVSTVLAGQKLGIKEVDDGIWLVSFMHYDLGYFDLEQKTVPVPVENQIRTYSWCNPPRIGRQRMRPALFTVRDRGASLSKAKCVRVSL